MVKATESLIPLREQFPEFVREIAIFESWQAKNPDAIFIDPRTLLKEVGLKSNYRWRFSQCFRSMTNCNRFRMVLAVRRKDQVEAKIHFFDNFDDIPDEIYDPMGDFTITEANIFPVFILHKRELPLFTSNNLTFPEERIVKKQNYYHVISNYLMDFINLALITIYVLIVVFVLDLMILRQ